MRSPLALLLATSLLAPTALATTYVVDDSGGPGVDFTDIAQALPSLVPGDVLVVRAGNYAGFTLDVPVSIVGENGAGVGGGISIVGTAAGTRTTLAGLAFRWLRVQQCLGAVLLEELSSNPGFPDSSQIQAFVTVEGSSDVRLRGLSLVPSWSIHGRAGVRAVESRVEVVHSIVRGANGRDHDIYTQLAPPGPGGDGIVVLGASQVHVYASFVQGGQGGGLGPFDLCDCPTAEDGGAGIRVGTGAEALVAGPAYAAVVGGWAGLGPCGMDGQPGNGIAVAPGGTLRLSGATVEAGPVYDYLCGSLPQPAIDGPFVTAVPPDATLTIAGGIAQQPVQFTVEGEPGSQATLRLGRQLVVQPLPGVLGDQLVVPLRNWDLGVLPASWIATFSFAIPAASPPGAVFVAQARTVAPGGAVSLTNSVPLTRR